MNYIVTAPLAGALLASTAVGTSAAVLPAGEFEPSSSTPDALVRAIADYRSGVAAYNALPDAVTDAPASSAADSTFMPPLQILSHWSEPARSAQGAFEALDLASGEIDFLSSLGEAMFNATLGYLKMLAGPAATTSCRITTDDPASKVHRLMDELSEALDCYCGGRFKAIVEPRSVPGAEVVLKNITAASDATSAVAWVRDLHADGWIFALKVKNYRGNRIVDGDPDEIDDYAMHRAGGPHVDDTERLIRAIRKREAWAEMKRTVGGVVSRKMRVAIEGHAAAWQALEAACRLTDEFGSHFDPVNGDATYSRCERAEGRAFDRLLDIVPRSPNDLAAKGRYLRIHVLEKAAAYLSEEQAARLLTSLERA